jgi:hypothetical protein
MKVRAVWQFFEAEAENGAIHFFAPGGKEPVHTWNFKRQKIGDQLCLSDYVLPPKDGRRDHVAVFVVSAGEGIRERAEKAKHEGYYFKSHGVQALAIESAEACAEWLHRRIPRSGEHDHGGAIHFEISRETLQLWLSGLPELGGPGRGLETSAAGRDWRATDGRIHDGSGSERERASVSPSGLHVFQRRRDRGDLGGRFAPSRTSRLGFRAEQMVHCGKK